MLKWLKRKLAKWVSEELDNKPDKLSFILEVCEDDKLVRYRVTGHVGVCLRAVKMDSSNLIVERLIMESMCVDREQFHRLLRHFMGDVKIEWEEPELEVQQ